MKIKIVCTGCGAKIIGVKVSMLQGGHTFYLPPCSRCIENAREKGYVDGLTDGERIGSQQEGK